MQIIDKELIDKELIDDGLRNLTADSIKLWNDDLIESYTVNFEINVPEWRRNYEKLVYEFKNFSESLYIYPFEKLHITFLGWIDINKNRDEVVNAVRKITKGKEYSFEIGYLQCSNASVGIIAEPLFDMGTVRNNLRKELNMLDGKSSYSGIYERLGWVNFIRFKNKPAVGFFEKLWNVREYSLGKFVAKDITVFSTRSRTMAEGKCEEIEKIIF